MEYKLTLKSSEPCDIFIVHKSNKKYAIVVESRAAYCTLLDTNAKGEDTVLMCSRHAFHQKTLDVICVDDFALVNGAACYGAELSKAAKEVLSRELSSR